VDAPRGDYRWAPLIVVFQQLAAQPSFFGSIPGIGGGGTGIPYTFSLVVLMDGSIPKPKIEVPRKLDAR
jgi:hypothetical protein